MSAGVTAVDQVFTVGEKAWHNLDKNYQVPLTWDETLQHLNWEVGMVPAELQGKKSKRWFYTVRLDLYKAGYATVDDDDFPPGVLGMVGRIYKPIQNRDLWKFFEPLMDKGDAVFDTGGSILGGRKVWIQAKMSRLTQDIVKNDPVEVYLSTINSHDGTIRWIGAPLITRVVCQNTMAAALDEIGLTMHSTEDDAGMSASGRPYVTLKHTVNAQFALTQAHEVLGLTAKRGAEIGILLSQIGQKAMSILEVKAFAKYLFPSTKENKGEKPPAAVQQKREQLERAFEADINNLDPNNQHTAWTAYNAATSFIDHGESKRQKDRRDWAWFGEGALLRQRAMNWLIRKFLKNENLEA